MSDSEPIARGVTSAIHRIGALTLTDLSTEPKWRVFGGYETVGPGTSLEDGDRLVWSVTPGEWTVLGSRPQIPTVVDLTHVRAMFRLTGDRSPLVINKLCALDLADDMFPDRAAARTLVAGVATEIVRDDADGTRSYLILPSRSFGAYLAETMLDAAGEFGTSVY